MIPILARLHRDVPFMAASEFNAMVARALGGGTEPLAAEHPYLKKLRDGLKPQMERVRDVAVIPVLGALARRPDLGELAYGEAEDTDHLRALVSQAAADPEVRGILLNVDSPGGYYGGGPELSDAVRAAASVKPVVAFASGQMASLSYWVSVGATAIVASRSAAVGSIGVYIAAYDFSAYLEKFGVKVEVFKNSEGTLKAMGVMGTSLTDEQRSYLQGRAQAGFDEFRKTVLDRRPNVKADAMKGQTFTGPEAKAMGLVDRVGDMDFAMSVLRREIRTRGTA